MSHPKILIVVNRSGAAKDAYQSALARIGVDYDVAYSFLETQTKCVENKYSGLLIDIHTLVKCSQQEKLIAYNCINLYPAIRLMWEPKGEQIRLSPLEQSFSLGPEESLRYFIEERCRPFPPRSLRKYPRKSVNLNVRFCAGEEFSSKGSVKTFTVNVSRGGVFVHTVLPLKQGDTVWLQVLEFSDQTPLKARVCWSAEWGVRSCIPGVGAQFEELSEGQLEEIGRYVG